MPIKVAIPRETAEGERRVAISADVINRLKKLGIETLIERGAGQAANIADSLYQGASFFERKGDTLPDADIIWCVQSPTEAEIAKMKQGSILIGTLLPFKQPERVKQLQAKNITSFSMEFVPRISRAQSMDVLSSQASIAGYKAAIMGADLLGRFFPMLTTAAGTVRPSKVLVIGVGVAGLQAIATAKRLGAVVEAYDVRPETKQQIESLAAKAIQLDISATGEGGYARELSQAEKQQQQEELASYIAKANVLITTAAVPGRPAPKIVPDSTVEMMQAGSVIIDLAAESGGNTHLTQPGETIVHQGVTIHGPLNVASQVPEHASEMYSKNLFNFTLPMLTETGDLSIDFEDEVIAGTLLTHNGEIKNQAVREFIETQMDTQSKGTN
jgi:NAD(P) transhydrogenase subunit alpha